MKINSSSGISKTIYHNGSYLLLFEKRILESFMKFNVNNPSNKRRTLKV